MVLGGICFWRFGGGLVDDQSTVKARTWQGANHISKWASLPNGANGQPTSWRVRLTTALEFIHSWVKLQVLSTIICPGFPIKLILSTLESESLKRTIRDYQMLLSSVLKPQTPFLWYTPAGSHCGFDQHAMIRWDALSNNFFPVGFNQHLKMCIVLDPVYELRGTELLENVSKF